MKTDQLTEPAKTVFLQTVSLAISQLKQHLQEDYEQAYPQLGEVIHLVLDEEEANAWKLTAFPHLILPDLVEAHIAKLDLTPVETKHANVFSTHCSHEMGHYQHAFA